MYSFAADAVVVIHFVFILFVVFGGLLVFRWPRISALHLPAVAWGAAVEFCGWICPLTPLENRFREWAGENLYSGDFIEMYLVPLIYPAKLTASIQQVLGAAVILLNLVIYFFVIKKHRPFK